MSELGQKTVFSENQEKKLPKDNLNMVKMCYDNITGEQRQLLYKHEIRHNFCVGTELAKQRSKYEKNEGHKYESCNRLQ